MARPLTSSDDLHLSVPEGANAHLLWRAHNPPRANAPVAQVGYWRALDAAGENADVAWFDVNGDLAEAQRVLDEQAAPALAEALGLVTPAPVVVIERADGIQAEEASDAGSVLAQFAAESAEAPAAEGAAGPTPKRRGRKPKGA